MCSRSNLLSLLCCLFLFIFSACQGDDDTSEPLTNEPIPTPGQNPPNNGGGNPNPPNNNAEGDLSALPLAIPSPADNPNNAATINLGRDLFWDPVLSGELDVACATCHHPARGYSDGRDLPIGVGGTGFAENRQVGHTGLVPRNSPSIINTAYNGIDINGNVDPNNAEMFWDNRANGLEEQALLPMHSFAEMRGNGYEESETLNEVIAKLEAIPAYRQQFSNAFGNGNITADRIAQAISAFERTIVANNSPFDRYMRGDEEAMTALQITGMNTFVEIGCINCHNGPMLSDFDLHVLGVRDNPLLEESDDGNGNYAFRTPSLRNLRFTGPFMHNGEFNSLQQVLNFYDNNNNNSQNPNVNDNQLDGDLRRLRNINRSEQNEIIEFLNALNDENFDRRVPNDVPSGLNPGGRIGPN